MCAGGAGAGCPAGGIPKRGGTGGRGRSMALAPNGGRGATSAAGSRAGGLTRRGRMPSAAGGGSSPCGVSQRDGSAGARVATMDRRATAGGVMPRAVSGVRLVRTG
jgi:hypothetical protein